MSQQNQSQCIAQCVGIIVVIISQCFVNLVIYFACRRKKSQPFAKNTNIIVSVEGNIGSGKSTLLDRLQLSLFKNKKFIFVQEPVDLWENIKDENGKTMVQLFYGNQEEYSFSFQIMAYTSRLRILKKVLNENVNSIIVCERSLFTDKMVFAKMLRASNKINSVEYQIYLDLFNDFASEFPLHKIIYVEATPEICLNRVETRSRAGENTISLDYLTSCHNYHNDMMSELSVEKLVLDGNQDIFKQTHVLNEWLRTIQQFVEE
jgi:deoxyadenosine/deoxycytidine kinase